MLLNQEGDEYEEGSIIKIAKGETAPLDICIYPDLASNKDYTIRNELNITDINNEDIEMADEIISSVVDAFKEVLDLDFVLIECCR